MPNWVRNIVWFSGNKEKIANLKAFVKSEDSEFDFNKIIPMPKELNFESGGKESVAIACAEARMKGMLSCEDLERYSWLAEEMSFNAWADLGDKYLKNKKQWGFTTWYDWHCHYWGTKWNSCEVKWVTEYCVRFDTAWNAPMPLFARLADMFPSIKIIINYADENIGYNCDAVAFSSGGKDMFEFPKCAYYIEGSEEAEQFACGIWGLNYDTWKSGEDEYEFEEPKTETVLNLLE